MATLAKLRTDTHRVNEGVPIEVMIDGETFTITTRGFTQRYRNRLFELRRLAARELNRGLRPGQMQHTPDSLPPEQDDACQGQALAEECVLDVTGLDHEAGRPVSLDEFKEMLRQPADYPAVVRLALEAAMAVHAERTAEKDAATGN